MKTCIKLNEEDLKKVVKNQFRGLKSAEVAFFVDRNVDRGDTSYSIRAEVTTEEEVIAY
jgi:hypothetical protein